jgi:hypothetical protein
MPLVGDQGTVERISAEVGLRQTAAAKDLFLWGDVRGHWYCPKLLPVASLGGATPWWPVRGTVSPTNVRGLLLQQPRF